MTTSREGRVSDYEKTLFCVFPLHKRVHLQLTEVQTLFKTHRQVLSSEEGDNAICSGEIVVVLGMFRST